MNKIIAVIPVRDGSERVKHKNTREVGGEGLLQKKITTLLKSKHIHEIIVNSESDRLLEIAHNLGVTTIKRDIKYATSSIPANDAILNILLNTPQAHIVWAQATSPFITTERIDDLIKIYFEKIKQGYDSIATVKNLKEYIWKDGKPINYSLQHHPRSQDLIGYYALTFTLFIFPRDVGIKTRYFIGERPHLVEVTDREAVDIDTELDIIIANAVYENDRKKLL